MQVDAPPAPSSLPAPTTTNEAATAGGQQQPPSGLVTPPSVAQTAPGDQGEKAAAPAEQQQPGGPAAMDLDATPPGDKAASDGLDNDAVSAEDMERIVKEPMERLPTERGEGQSELDFAVSKNHVMGKNLIRQMNENRELRAALEEMHAKGAIDREPGETPQHSAASRGSGRAAPTSRGMSDEELERELEAMPPGERSKLDKILSAIDAHDGCNPGSERVLSRANVIRMMKERPENIHDFQALCATLSAASKRTTDAEAIAEKARKDAEEARQQAETLNKRCQRQQRVIQEKEDMNRMLRLSNRMTDTINQEISGPRFSSASKRFQTEASGRHASSDRMDEGDDGPKLKSDGTTKTPRSSSKGTGEDELESTPITSKASKNTGDGVAMNRNNNQNNDDDDLSDGEMERRRLYEERRTKQRSQASARAGEKRQQPADDEQQTSRDEQSARRPQAKEEDVPAKSSASAGNDPAKSREKYRRLLNEHGASILFNSASDEQIAAIVLNIGNESARISRASGGKTKPDYIGAAVDNQAVIYPESRGRLVMDQQIVAPVIFEGYLTTEPWKGPLVTCK
jgi:hypothetical protein